MRYPRRKITPTKSETIIMSGGLKEDTPQLELKAGELIDVQNYQEIDGAYHGYISLPGYERWDGGTLPSEVDIVGLTDYGVESKTTWLFESDLRAFVLDLSLTPHTIINTGVTNDPLKYKFLSSSYYFGPLASLDVEPIAVEYPLGSGDYGVTTDLSLRDEDWTFDTLIEASNAFTAGQNIVSKGLSYRLYMEANKMVFEYSTDGVAWNVNKLTSTEFISDGREFHFTICRRADTVYMFFDGDRDASEIDVGTDYFFENSDHQTVGGTFAGWMDEIRMSNTYRWVNDFDIPVLPYTTPRYYTIQVDDLAREAHRELIQKVPGVGPILGISIRKGIVGVARDAENGGLDPVKSEIYRGDVNDPAPVAKTSMVFDGASNGSLTSGVSFIDDFVFSCKGFVLDAVSDQRCIISGSASDYIRFAGDPAAVQMEIGGVFLAFTPTVVTGDFYELTVSRVGSDITVDLNGTSQTQTLSAAPFPVTIVGTRAAANDFYLGNLWDIEATDSTGLVLDLAGMCIGQIVEYSQDALLPDLIFAGITMLPHVDDLGTNRANVTGFAIDTNGNHLPLNHALADVNYPGPITGDGTPRVGNWYGPIESTKMFLYEGASNKNADADPLVGTTQGFIPKDISLEHPLFAGDLITGATSGATATVRSHTQYGGDFRTSPGLADAYGILLLENIIGTWIDGEDFEVKIGDSVGPADFPYEWSSDETIGTIKAGTLEDFILQPGGTYQFIDAAFDLLPNVQREIQPFFVNGVNCPCYYDNDVIIPIIHENLPSTRGVHPVHIADFKNRLWLAYPDGRLWYSEVGNPLGYNTTLGSGEIYLEDEITGMVAAPGDVLIVFCRNSTQIIKTITEYQGRVDDEATLDYGFFNETFSKRSGAITRTAERMLGEVYFLDDRGLTSMSATDTYSDFGASAISKNVQRTLLGKIDQVVTSAISRRNNQYRIFFEDKSGLIFTFDHEKKIKGVTKLQYDHRMTCFKEGERLDGTLMLLWGDDEGYVYQMDSGTSFDGNVIKTKLTTAYFSYNSSSNWKRFRKIILEAQAAKGLVIRGKPEFNYRDPNIPRSIELDYTSIGQGGKWGKDAWANFQYGSGEVQNPTLYLTGYGNNMSITIATEDKHQEPHVINSIITEYSMNARKM